MGSSLNQSAASLRDILEQEGPEEFQVLEASKMYGDGQKRQMKQLNRQLEDYMKMNKDLDNEIADLNNEIQKAKRNANHQDGDIIRKVEVIRTEKKEIDILRTKQKETNILLEKVKLRNENCEGDNRRYEMQIRELEVKIGSVSKEIEKADDELRKDQDEIDRLEPYLKNLLVEQKEREVKHKRKVEELIVNRKKTQIPDVPEIQKHVPAMLNNYRNSQIGNDSKPAEIKQLESKVEQARLESRRLDKEILVVHRKKDQIELEIKKMEMEIRQSEANCEGIRKQTAQIEENNRKELA